eukprot:NODE_1083_length_1019_cov_173.795964_g1038_i0.p1 GENE.NODE_1083_length_1019_cov_173.795964_g1038_i0~~NODE_1083_length_1019_cov_173.795964_g1038_i0.p1  ORF type:complete len:326 (-),score=106.98 NODE_1083_length_1019_cov_173.795964_g1038_i0:40-918(-)
MGFVKVIKNKPYFKRYQTKYRRRREGKTDYLARRALVTQDKNKYHSPKYRLVVRFTNTDVICQIVYSKIEGDHVMTAAYAHELPRYGVKAGLTNYAGAYCTGLLCARRLLKKIGLDTKYAGVEEATGEMFYVEELEDGPRPFKAYLDIGLARATTGSKVFGAMKGAVDGGIDVPHTEKRFPGYDAESKDFSAETLRKRILGEHVSEYMTYLEGEDAERYRAHFARFLKAGVTADLVADMYKKAHAAIRADPSHTKKEAKKPAVVKKFGKTKLNLKERRNKYKQQKAAFFENQ